jgi:hypothetical protein
VVNGGCVLAMESMKSLTINILMRVVNHCNEVDVVPEWSNMYRDQVEYISTGGVKGTIKNLSPT